MSEQERTNFLKMAVSRAPGKRQIKPSAAIFEVEAGPADDDEDDEDFIESNDQSKSSDEFSEEESSSVSDSEKDEMESEDEGDLTSNDVEEEIGDEEMPSTSEKKQIKNKPLICSVCLNTRAITKGVEVIQCDRCGLAVHEVCYGVEELNDVSSVTSSASTEPWFCEPCMFGLNVVPYCELCPNRLGAFKKANVNGSWVHLLCALYTQGISFGDTDHLTAISWQEMDFRLFGRKACIACTNKLDAKTGVTVQCEAGLCKNFYHVTCAQKLGLLMDGDNEEYHHFYQNGQLHNDFNFLLCKRHNHSDLLKTKKEAYANFVKQETKRMVFFNRFLLNSRQEAKRQKQLQNYFDRMKRFENFVTTNKKTRMLHNNSYLLNMFMEKAELIGISPETFENNFLTISGEQIPAIPPSFSVAFIKYFENRDKIIIPEEEERLIKAQKEKVKNETLCQKLELSLKQAQDNYLRLKEENVLMISLLDRFCNALNALNVPKKNFSSTLNQIFMPTPKHISKNSPLTPPKRQKRKSKNNSFNEKLDIDSVIDTQKNSQDFEFNQNDVTKTSINKDLLKSTNNVYEISTKTKNPLKRKLLTGDKSLCKVKKQKISNSFSESEKKDEKFNNNLTQNFKVLEKESTASVSSINSDNLNLAIKSPSKRPNILSHSKPSLIKANLTVKLEKVSLPLQLGLSDNNFINKNQKNDIQQDEICLSNTASFSKNTLDDTLKKDEKQQSTQSSALLLLLKSHSENSSLLLPKLPLIFLNICFTCSKSNNQEQLIYCDTCKHYYHIGCLDPPLKKMPAIRKNFAFQCSDCAFPSSSSEEDNKNDKKEENLSTNSLNTSRQKRSASKPNNFSMNFNLSTPKRRKKKTYKKSLNNLSKDYDQTKEVKLPINQKFTEKNKNAVKKSYLKNSSKKILIVKQNLTNVSTSNSETLAAPPLPPSPIFVQVDETLNLENGMKNNDILNQSMSNSLSKRARKQSLNLTPSQSFSSNNVSSSSSIIKMNYTPVFSKNSSIQKIDDLEQKIENNMGFLNSSPNVQNNVNFCNYVNERRKVAAILRHNYKTTPNKSDYETNKNKSVSSTSSTLSSSTKLPDEVKIYDK